MYKRYKTCHRKILWIPEAKNYVCTSKIEKLHISQEHIFVIRVTSKYEYDLDT